MSYVDVQRKSLPSKGPGAPHTWSVEKTGRARWASVEEPGDTGEGENREVTFGGDFVDDWEGLWLLSEHSEPGTWLLIN